jgi:lipoate-protein ligase A
MKTFRLIRSTPASAEYNMALDKSIFDQYLVDGVPVLRLYFWQAPSLTYGISQNPESEINLSACLANGVQRAKRITGGGVLFHDREITYSLTCSKVDIGEDKDLFVSYKRSCAFLLNFYESLGLNANFAVESEDFARKSAPHQLCSASREKYDILLNGMKIGGNAQKRTRQVIFQHGSIPLDIDWDFLRLLLPGLPANISLLVTDLNSQLSVKLDQEVLVEKLIFSFAQTYQVNLKEWEVGTVLNSI